MGSLHAKGNVTLRHVPGMFVTLIYGSNVQTMEVWGGGRSSLLPTHHTLLLAHIRRQRSRPQVCKRSQVNRWGILVWYLVEHTTAIGTRWGILVFTLGGGGGGGTGIGTRWGILVLALGGGILVLALGHPFPTIFKHIQHGLNMRQTSVGSAHSVRRTSHYSVYPGMFLLDYIQMCKQGLERREVILTAHPSHTIAGPRKGPAKPTTSLQEITSQPVVYRNKMGAYWYWH